MENAWWHQLLRIVQFNLQIRDTPRMDPVKMAQDVADMHGNAVIINVSDSVVWYNTEVENTVVNPYLPKEYDLLGEIVEQMHKHGIKVIARCVYWGLSEEIYYQKPQWVQRRPDGSAVAMGDERPGGWTRFFATCPNSDYKYEAGLKVAQEMFHKYDLDGFFTIGGSSREGNCWCGNCQKKYLDLFGKKMPMDPDELDPLWNYENSRHKTIAFMDAIMKDKADMPFYRYYWPFMNYDVGDGHRSPADNIDDMALEGNALITEAQDALALGFRKLPEWHTPTVRIKMGNTIDNFPPPMGMIHSCPGMDWRHTCVQDAEFMYWASQIPANGGSYCTSFTGFVDTITDKRMIKTITKLNSMTEAIADDMYAAKSDCRVLLLSDGGVYVQGWAEALICAHIDFDMLAQYQLCYDRLAKYPVVILPKDFEHNADSEEIFKAYVENGGKLIVEGTDEISLAPVRSLLGVQGTIVPSEDLEATYLRVEPGDSGIQEKLGECELVPLRGKVGYSEPAPGSLVFATWVPPFAPRKVAGFPPERATKPIERTNIPLCTVSKYGKGSVMFLSYEPSRLIHEYALKDMFTVMEGYVDYMLGEDRVITFDVPSRVITTVFKKDNTQMVHLINGIGQRPIQETIPIYDLRFTIKLDGKQVESVVSKISGQSIDYYVDKDVLHVKLAKLDVWDMLLIQYK